VDMLPPFQEMTVMEERRLRAALYCTSRRMQ